MATTSFMIPEDTEAEALLRPLAEPLEVAFRRLGDSIGPIPPFRVRVAANPLSPIAFDQSACLEVAPSLKPESAEGWHLLYGLFLEAGARFALAVRGNILPERLPELESRGSVPWAGGGLYLARHSDGAGSWVEEGLLDVRSRRGQGLLDWGRGGASYWEALAETIGHARTIDALIAACRGEEAASPEAFCQFMASRGIPWADPILKKLGRLGPDIAERLPAGGGGRAGEALSWRAYLLPKVGPGHRRTLVGEGCKGELEGKGLQAPALLSEPGALVLVTGPSGEGGVRVAASPLLGSWTLKGADFAGQVFGVRGLTVRFEGDGGLFLDIGDAMVGPVNEAALGMASRVGVSGFAKGRWYLEGDQLQVRDLKPDDLSVHGRSSKAPMAWPAEDAKERAVFFAQQIQAIPWSIREVEDGILLEGRFGGIPASLRLGPDIPMMFMGVVPEA